MNGEIIRRLEQSFEREDQRAVIQAAATATATVIASQWGIAKWGEPPNPIVDLPDIGPDKGKKP